MRTIIPNTFTMRVCINDRGRLSRQRTVWLIWTPVFHRVVNTRQVSVEVGLFTEARHRPTQPLGVCKAVNVAPVRRTHFYTKLEAWIIQRGDALHLAHDRAGTRTVFCLKFEDHTTVSAVSSSAKFSTFYCGHSGVSVHTITGSDSHGTPQCP